MPDHEEAVREAEWTDNEWRDYLVDVVPSQFVDEFESAIRSSERAKYAALVEAARAVVHYQSPHGHVTPRPDGVKARCGGPKLCISCDVEAALAALQSKEGTN